MVISPSVDNPPPILYTYTQAHGGGSSSTFYVPPPCAHAMSRIETQYSSSNFSSREGSTVKMIVLHATVGSFHSSLVWLTTPQSRVSTHYLISKTGRVLRLVAEENAAWHAGKSQWFDLDSEAIQHESLGIELENANDGRDPYPDVQMTALLDLCRPIIARYRIVPDMIVRHLDIAIPKGRKTDPAGFPFAEFKKSVYAPLPPPPPPPAPVPYTVRGLPVYQRADHTGALWGHLREGDVVEIDNLANGHLADGRGFVDVSGLDAV